MEGLKPCPFCGSTQIYVTHTRYYDNNDTVCVFCNACKQYVVLEANEAEELNDRTKAAAVAAWNTRAERTCRWDCKYGEYEWVCTVTCTACGYVLHDGEYESHWAYCPNCGAKVVS